MKKTKTKSGFFMLFHSLLLTLLITSTITSVLAAQNIFTVQETERVKIKTEATDPDNDKITYSYSLPLDKNGEWQTSYNDSGTYLINISASDGKSTSSQVITLIVENKNRLPYLTEQKIDIKEGQQIDLKSIIKDDDDDILTFKFEKPFDKSGVWKTTYNDEGYYVTNIIANDGFAETTFKVEINILPTNQYPILKKIFSENKEIRIAENSTLNFWVEAQDPEQETLKYQWTLDQKIIGEEPKGQYLFDLNSSGEHTLKLTIKDSSTITNKEWNIKISNLNQPPFINIPKIVAKEGEKIKLDLPKKDNDGDIIKYTFLPPFDSQGEWQTNYQQAGNYRINISAFDGEATAVSFADITIIDVDLPPSLTLPAKFYLKEGEEFVWKVDLFDSDNDTLTVTFNNTPPNSYYDSQKKIFRWTPSYDTIKRKEGLLSNILNSLRLEKYVLGRKTQELGIKVCGKELCRKGITTLSIENKNQKPVITNIQSNLLQAPYITNTRLSNTPFTDNERITPKSVLNNTKKNETNLNKTSQETTTNKEPLQIPTQFTITEGEKIHLIITAQDPDNDFVRYSFAPPFNKNGEWQTKEGDKGEYSTSLSASDGSLEDIIPIKLKVVQKNKQPTLNIKEEEYSINEGDSLSFSVTASDPNNESVLLWLENPPEGSSFKEGTFSWKADYTLVQNKTNDWWHNLISRSPFWNKKLNDEKTIKWLKFTASDGQFNVSHPVKITIKNTNQAPKIISIYKPKELSVKVNEPIIIKANAIDPDNDPLNYRWSFTWHESNIKGTNTIERTFLEPGNKKVTLTVSDGRDSTKQEWLVHVLPEEYQENPIEQDPKTALSNAPTFRVYIIDQKK